MLFMKLQWLQRVTGKATQPESRPHPLHDQLVVAAGDIALIPLLIHQLQHQDAQFSGLLSTNRSWVMTSLQPRLQLT